MKTYTCALSLHAAGTDVQVYKSVADRKAIGVGITLQPNAVRELEDISRAYKIAAGFDPEALDKRPSLTAPRAAIAARLRRGRH